MKKQNKSKLNSQRGALTIVTVVVLLIAATLISFFAVKFGLQDQRMSGNEKRHIEAFANAEAGLDQAASYLRANPGLHNGEAADGWQDCSGSSVFPCSITNADKVLASVTKDASGAISTITSSVPLVISNTAAYLVLNTSGETVVIGEGQSVDQTGSSRAQVSYVEVSLLTPGEIPPIMAPALNLNGNFTIVADPNNGAGSTGIPISGWTSSNSSGTGSWQTCNSGEYRDSHTGAVCVDAYDASNDWSNCACTEALSDSSVAVSDMLDIYTQSPADFPDPFEYVFGVGETVDNIQARFMDSGKYYPGDCTGLDTLDLSTLKKPWVWVEGDCNVPDVGTDTLPVVLVVEGRMTLNSNTEAWGLLVSLSEVQTNGSAIVHGSLVADGTADISNGGYQQVYSEDVLTALQDDSLNTVIGKLKYSWRDF